MEIILIILILMVGTLGYTTINLYNKNKKQESILYSYLEYLNKISGIIEFSDNKMKEVDAKGSFSSDDEVGFFFEEIKQIQEILNQFIVK